MIHTWATGPALPSRKRRGGLKGVGMWPFRICPASTPFLPTPLEEVIARSYLVNEKPDAILNIVDDTNIERNLYLTTQLIALGLPVSDKIDRVITNQVLALPIFAGIMFCIYAVAGADFGAMSAYSFMIFNLLCAFCFAAMGAIKREMNNAKWTSAIGHMCVFAYSVSLIAFQLSRLIAGEASFGLGTVVARNDLRLPEAPL